MVAPAVDVALSPFTLASAACLRIVRLFPLRAMAVSKAIFGQVGVFPIRDHYYEPMFNKSHLHKSLNEDRELPGLDLNFQQQLETLEAFHFQDELRQFPVERTDEIGFHYHNGQFESLDAEYLYSIIRLRKPRKIVEIGSGYSTLMALSAVRRNAQEDSAHSCEMFCVEPYENRWLEGMGATVIRELVQKADGRLFTSLDRNDILFIDSSHMIRPQGDVVCEYLEILPRLKPGVLVHVHDIFTPKDYPDSWVRDSVVFFNEQYLLEAFLSFNKEYTVLGALHYLAHHHRRELIEHCPPVVTDLSPREMPRSFWLMRV